MPRPKTKNLGPCSVPGCQKRAERKEMCARHYWAEWKHGDPLWVEKLPTREEKIWARVNKNGPVPDFNPELGPCWLWTGNVEDQGYGVFHIGGGKTVKAYRLVYEMTVGEISEGLQPDHLCRVRACVNPSHLEPVTKKENVLRGIGPTAINAQKTYCIHGHPFEGDNLIIRSNGNRDCRTCATAAKIRYQEKRKVLRCA